MSLVSINPATGKRIARYDTHTAAELERALVRAERAFQAWRTTPVAQRAALLRKLARAVRKQSETLSALATAEMGKPITQSRAEVEKCAAVCEFYAAHGPAMIAPERPPAAPGNSIVRYDPLGPVLAVMPWNFPFWQAFRAFAPALLGGNVLLLKHAANVTGCALALEKLFADAGAPRGLFQSLLMPSAKLGPLIADPRIAGVTLTGSTAAGRSVAALAGAALKPVVLELGGSDPAIVLADADLDEAAELCAASRLLNSGQSCICAKRFIVDRRVRRDFEKRLVARMAARRLGDPTDAKTEIGPLARADLRDELHAQVQHSTRRGARLLLGGEIPAGAGFFYPATVLTEVRPGQPAYDDEMFGPVAAVISARDTDDAIRLANHTIYGLAATIHTRNRTAARALAARIDAGTVFINGVVRSDPALPFGGVKQSGHGRELGAWGLKAFLNAKTVVG